MTDQEIIQGLIDRDERITREFFFRRCQPLFFALIAKFYPSGADYDELVSELYLHLMEDNARRLRKYEGRASIYQWLKRVAGNYFLDKLSRERIMDNASDNSLMEKAKEIPTDNFEQETEIDVAAILDQIENENYRLVLQKHIIEDMSFDDLEKITGIKKANLYNIKRRALNALEKIARIARTQGDVLCAVRCEEYVLHCFGIHKTLLELRDLAQNAGWLTENGAFIHDLGNTAEALGLQVERKEEGTLQDVVQALDEGKRSAWKMCWSAASWTTAWSSFRPTSRPTRSSSSTRPSAKSPSPSPSPTSWMLGMTPTTTWYPADNSFRILRNTE